MAKPSSAETGMRPENEGSLGVEAANARLTEGMRDYRTLPDREFWDDLEQPAKDLVTNMMLGREMPSFGNDPFGKMLNELAPLLAEKMREIQPGIALNKVGLFRSKKKWPSTDESAYFDATRIVVDQFGGVHSAGEMITEKEALDRAAERKRTVKAGKPIAVTAINEERQPAVALAFDSESGKYRQVQD